MLTRIYGTAWETAEQLEEYLELLEEAKKRDHRVLGPKLGLFVIDPAGGQGFAAVEAEGRDTARNAGTLPAPGAS